MRERKSGNTVGSFSYPTDQEPVMKELRIIAAREGKSSSQIIFEILQDYVKSHSEGNSTFKLDKWQENPEFVAIPTLLSPSDKWNKFLLENCTEEDLTKIRIAANFITKTIDHKKTNDYWENHHKVGGWRVEPNVPKNIKILPNVVKDDDTSEIYPEDEEEVINE